MGSTENQNQSPVDLSFSSHKDLWITTLPSESAWARRLDWFLNFQIMKAELHEAREMSPELKAILTEAEVVSPRPEVRSDRLMIASANLLPNRTTVVLPLRPELAQWAKACHALWKELNAPSTRVFLPDGATIDAFVSAWPEKPFAASVDVVAPLLAHTRESEN